MPTDAELRALVEKWRNEATLVVGKRDWSAEQKRTFQLTLRVCADELESLLRAQEPEQGAGICTCRGPTAPYCDFCEGQRQHAGEPEQAARERLGARCRECGHYETSLRRATERYAHCPSCGRGAHWIEVHDEAGQSLSQEVIRTLRHCLRVASLAGDLPLDEKHAAQDALDAAERNGR